MISSKLFNLASNFIVNSTEKECRDPKSSIGTNPFKAYVGDLTVTTMKVT